jgi:hypothetical protein
MPEVTPFSKAFGSALGQVMKRRGVRQIPLSEAIGRNQGFISERLRGLRAVDTDMVEGVARICGTDPQVIVGEIMDEMYGSGAAMTPDPGLGDKPPGAKSSG